MMFLRGVLAFLGSVLFFVALFATLLWTQVSNTVLHPQFVIEELREADVYEFALVDLLSSFVEEAKALDTSSLPMDVERNPLAASGLTTEEIVGSVNRAVPPSWARSVVEQTLEQVGGYLTGRRDRFSMTPRAGTRIVLLSGELEGLLRRGDAYGFAYDEMLDSWIERQVASAEVPDGFEIPAQRVSLAVRNTFPTWWTQRQFEAALEELASYMAGETDRLEIRVDLDERSSIALQEIKSLLRDIDAYDQVSEKLIVAEAEKAVTEGPPLFIDLESARLVEAVRKTVTPKWLRTQTEHAIDEAGAYVIGESDAFEVRVEIGDRVEIVLAEFEDMLIEAGMYDLPYTEFVEPRLYTAVGEPAHLPFGVVIRGAEIVEAVRRETPDDWFRRHSASFFSDSTPYLTGKTLRFESKVSLVVPKRAIFDPMTELAGLRIDSQVRSLQLCANHEEAVYALANRSSTDLPACIEPGTDTNQLLRHLGMNIPDTVSQAVMGGIPDNAVVGERHLRQWLASAGADSRLDLLFIHEAVYQAMQGPAAGQREPVRLRAMEPWERAASNVATFDYFMEIVRDDLTYDDGDLRQYLAERGDGADASFDELRAALRDGWVFTDADLHRVLRGESGVSGLTPGAPDPVKLFDDVRGFLSDDLVYTEEAFREDVSESMGAEGLASLDRARTFLKFMAVFRWVVWAPLALLLLSIGVLVARSWPGRAAWAMAVLLASSALIYTAFSPDLGSLALTGPVYEATRIPDVYNSLEELLLTGGGSGNFANTSHMAQEKMLEVAESMLERLSAGLSNAARSFAVIGAVGLVVALVWGASNSPRIRHGVGRAPRALAGWMKTHPFTTWRDVTQGRDLAAGPD